MTRPLVTESGTAPPKLLYTPAEAAALLSMSRAHFYRYVLHELHSFREGHKRLIPLRELEAYTERRSA